MEYKEIIEKRGATSVAEEGENYYLGNIKNNETHINNEHDKIFRKVLDVKSEAVKFINKTLNLSEKNVIEELIKEKTYISKIMLIEKHKNTEELIKYLKAIVEEVIEHKKDYNQQAEEVFVIMIKRILMKKIGSERANKVIKKLEGVDEGMLTSLATIEEENKMIFSKGRKEGKIEIAKKLLKKKFTVEEIAEITGLNKKYIK